MKSKVFFKKYRKFLLIPYFWFFLYLNPKEPMYMIGSAIGLLIVLAIPYFLIKWVIKKVIGNDKKNIKKITEVV